MHYLSDLFDKVLYMFWTGPLSIIRSISTLYTHIRWTSNSEIQVMSSSLLDGMVLERLRQNKKTASGSSSNALYSIVPEECNSDVAENSLTIDIYRVMREQ